jgi:hypothetical protein
LVQGHEWKKQTRQPHKVKAMVLKRVVMKGQNPKHHDSAVYNLNDEE